MGHAMIFLSHNHRDKRFVSVIAEKLADVYGRDNVFYDSWSIQPGEGIIDKMNLGMENVSFFFFFVTENSLASNMVKMEWQNALIKASSGKCKFIPIRCQNISLPALLTQPLYIDLYSYGIDVAIRQIIDVINQQNTYIPNPEKYSNLSYDIKDDDGGKIVKLSAMDFLEPIADFMMIMDNTIKHDDVVVMVNGESSFTQGFIENASLENGMKVSGATVGLNRGLTPTMPMYVSLRLKDGSPLNIFAVLHRVSTERYAPIPHKADDAFRVK